MYDNDTTTDAQSTIPRGRRGLTRRTRAVAAIGGTAVAATLGLGGIAMANAQETPDTTTTQSQPAQAGTDQGADAQGQNQNQNQNQGQGEKGGRGERMAAELATALGVDEQKVSDALEEIRSENTPDKNTQGKNTQEKGTTPTEQDRQARDSEMASKLAEKLGVDQQKVTDAMTTIRTQHQQQETERLSTSLDQAVSAGTLTEADKASVLKAQQAGVLGGGHGGGR